MLAPVSPTMKKNMPWTLPPVVRKLLALPLTLLAASLLVFVVLDVLPGDAAQMRLGVDADPQAVAAMARELGLDAPAWRRYLDWLVGLCTGRLGMSLVHDVPVADLVVSRFGLTLVLALSSMTLAMLLSVVLALFAVRHRGGVGDWLVRLAAQTGLALPSFWLAILLMLLFAVQWRLLPAGGFPGWDAGVLPVLQSLLLPTLALALAQTAVLVRLLRTCALEVMGEDFVRTARAKGLSRRAVLWRHVLRNAMIPVLTVLGLQFAALLAGSVVVENVFHLPGIGRLMLQSIANRDVVVVRNCVMLLVALVMLVNFTTDWLCTVLDPRLRQRRTARIERVF